MNSTEHAILAALADGKARTSADLITKLGEKPARVRYWLKSLADEGRLELVDTDFGDRCPCCKRALRRPVALWRLAAPIRPPEAGNGAQRHAPSPSSGIDSWPPHLKRELVAAMLDGDPNHAPLYARTRAD